MSKIDNEIKEGTPRFKKGDAFVGMAPHPLVFMEVNEVKVSQSYINDNGGKNGGDIVENIAGNIVDVPSLSPVCPKPCHKLIKGGKQPPVQRLQPRMKRLQVRHSQSSTAAIQTAAMW